MVECALIVERQPRLRRIPRGNPAPARGGAARVQGIPRAVAARQGQGRIRPVHGGSRPAASGSGTAAGGLSALSLSAPGGGEGRGEVGDPVAEPTEVPTSPSPSLPRGGSPPSPPNRAERAKVLIA